jgi:3-hydroxyisobutyrate dehydrogenase
MGETVRVGFIGLGDMGGAMALRIVNDGLPVTVWGRRSEALAEFPPDMRAATRRELAERSDIVSICVFDDDGVRDVLLGPDGVLAWLAPGAVVLIHSTVSNTVCAEVAAAAERVAVAVLDAPVSGARPAAEAGTLTIMVGGPQDAFDRVLPLLRSYGRLVCRLGDLGSGQTMKVLNNVLNFANGRLASIAVETGMELGLEPDAVMDVLGASSGRSFSLESIRTKLLPDPDFTRHAATMVEKDTRLFREICREAGLSDTVLAELAGQRVGAMVPLLPDSR